MTAPVSRTLSLDEALQQAVAHHQARRLPEAEQLYRAILQAQPNQPDANHNLGVLARQVGQHAAGLPYLKTALDTNPSREQYVLSYAEALLATGQAGEALNVLQAAMQRGLNTQALQALWQTAEGSAPNVPEKGAAPTPVEMHQLAVLFNARRHEEAEGGARLLLEQYPDSGFAWKVLGAALQEQGKDALSALQKAVELLPDDAEAHNNLGNALRDRGQLDDAEASYRRALQIKPDFAMAHNNLGNALQDRGQHNDAVASYRRALEIKPDYAEAHYNIGFILKDLGQLDDAVASYRRALEIKPDYAEAHLNLGAAQQDLGRLEEAVVSYRRALEAKPNDAKAHNNLGVALQELGQIDNAVASYRRALEIKPDYAEAYLNLGAAQKDLGYLDEAVQSYHRALEIKPDYAEAYLNLGVAQQDLGQLDDAAVSYRCALKIKHDDNALKNLANISLVQDHLDEAETSYRRALEINHDDIDAHNNFGNTMLALGQNDEAIASFRRALEIKTDHAAMYSNLLFALNYHPDKSGAEIYAAYREYDERFCLPHRTEWRAHSNSRTTQRRLKVGYVSPDFRMHSCRNFLEPLLVHHDKNAVEVYAHAELAREDEVSARYRGYVDHWVPTRGMSDDALTERIRADGIDILVDLAGHTAQNRLRVFARKPAPVSISWMGYGYTTGLTAIDYFLSDEAFTPEGSEGLFSETPWCLETPGYAFRPSEGMGSVSSLPALERGYVTFGTLTRAVRINHRTIRVWSEILKAVPNSRLLIDSRNFKDPVIQERLATRFAAYGIGRDRLEIGYHSPPWDVLRGLDIGLDCFPHNSGTTLLEALYMGVPFVTLAGRPSVGRLGSSILEGAGHPEWIAGSEDDYVAKAVKLASDIVRLSKIRSELRDQVESSPLRDEEGFARKVEDAYRRMWKIWCEKSDIT